MDSEQKRRILDAHMHLPTQGISLSEKKEIVYEEEIPLAIQIATSKNEISSYVVDYFYQPEEYEKFDYEHVYAITVEFSQNTIE